MIVNLDKFVAQERPQWERLDRVLRRIADDPMRALPLEEVRELERLYQRASADLARLATFSAEPEARHYLESLVARAYAEIHGATAERQRASLTEWLVRTLPRTFRRHLRAFWLTVALTLAGAVFGGLAVAYDPDAKPVILPFSHLLGNPAERVAKEESQQRSRHASAGHTTFASHLMTHNIQVSFLAVALGLTCGAGTLVLLFYNGAILGAVVTDYVLAGQGVFVAGWLLPHGVIEIPAILVAGQAGFVLADAMLARGRRGRLGDRLRAATGDVVTLCLGVMLMLVWAGAVESFLSQYHEPVIPYAAKIAFGLAEGAALLGYLALCGRGARAGEGRTP